MYPPRRRRAVLLPFVFLLALLTASLAPGVGAGSAQAAEHTTVGDVTGFERDGDAYLISAGEAKARVSFTDASVLHLRLAPDGHFTDPVGDDVVLPQGEAPRTTWQDRSDRYEIATSDAVLRVYKHPLRFGLYRPDGSKVWEETRGITFSGEQTTQSLGRGPHEQFFGTGMQNGSFSHRGQQVEVGVDYDWNEGGHPNSVPFYVSSKGYGVYRNTYSPGTYSFGDPVTVTHQERRFDAYYFVGNGLKDVIGRYTQLTGKPFMPPVYGLEPGDSDCYLHNANRGERHTLDALKVADGYVEHDMPLGWMLVNDGYGCGYEKLAQTAEGLQQRKAQLGLWTEDGLDTLADQVRAGQRVAKLDVAWVGPGYKKALDGCKDAYRGIEDNSDARGFTWAPESWSGAQRCGVQWSGDQAGSWDYIRWQIPTYAGATMSGLAYTTGDVDGIFGGSAQTYVRDLEWKSFLPVMMTMDGWAAHDKQPWRRGEPYTSISRKYLKLKESLLPYMYSYAAKAHRTGVGPTRPLALEYPDDPKTATDAVKYEFLSGEDFLVAPVYSDTSVRDGIYLPKGTWVDYWTGRTYQGPTTVDGYQAPLDTLPLFVRAGAAVPRWPGGIRSYLDRDPDSPVAWDVYPQGRDSFTLYEDDGVTRGYRDGASARQKITVTAPHEGAGKVTIDLGASVGHFDGKAARRPYRFTVHTGDEPAAVTLGHRTLPHLTSEDTFAHAEQGWWYDAGYRGGVVRIKSGSRPTDEATRIVLHGSSAVGGAVPGAASTLSGPQGAELGAGEPGKVSVEVTAGKAGASGTTVSLSAPEGWQVGPAQELGRLEPGGQKQAVFEVTPPADAEPGSAVLTAHLDARAAGAPQHTALRFAVSTVPAPPHGDTWASDMAWIGQSNGWGPPERDRSNGETGDSDGATLTLDGTTYAKGIGAHANSDIEVYLGGRCTLLTADVGIDDEIPRGGGVRFSVTADGETLWTSPELTAASDTVAADVPLDGARHVHLKVTDSNGGLNGDHGDWANAKFTCA